MKRMLAFAYGVTSYALFFATLLYAIGFLGNFGVPQSIDSAREATMGMAMLINTLLLVLFAVQHSVMARPAFKRWWMRFVPQPVERSTYVLFSSLVLMLLFWQWRPMGGVIWDVQAPVLRTLLYGVFAVGWLVILASTFMIDHFDLFGLRQVWLYLRGRAYTSPRFRTPVAYRFIRHPLYVGWFTVFWATPTMTAAHLLFAVATTGYILLAIPFEERDLMASLGAPYAEYRKRVPLFVPRIGRRNAM